jgi:hypothetical protein
MKNTIKMEWVKSTKGTHVYGNSDPETSVATIYIKRSGLPSEPPGHITLTIEYDVE